MALKFLQVLLIYYIFLLCGLIKVVAFWGFGFCLEVIVSLQPNRDFARKEELKRLYERKKDI